MDKAMKANGTRELNIEDMGQVASGWEFHSEGKYLTWLNGYDITCPYCKNASADVVKKIAARPSEVLFRCEACRKDFYLRWDRLYNKVIVVKS